MVIFRENTEDIYAGHRVRRRAPRTQELLRAARAGTSRMATRRSASRRRSGIGIKPVSREGTERLVRAAIDVRARPTSARA